MLRPPYAAVAHGSVPQDLLWRRLCYIVSSGASFVPGWAFRWLRIRLDIFNEYLFFKEVNRLFFSKSHSYLNVDESEEPFSELFEQYSLTEPYIFLGVVIPVRLSGAIPGQSSS